MSPGVCTSCSQTPLPRRLLCPPCSKGQPVTLGISVPNRVPASTEELRHMEAAHQVGLGPAGQGAGERAQEGVLSEEGVVLAVSRHAVTARG